MIRTYLELDKTDKIKRFILFIKNYAKACDVCDSSVGFLSSYSWVILCLHFLMRHELIPNLQVKKGLVFSDGYDTTFTELSELPYSYYLRLQKLTVTEMIRMFCNYYCMTINFDTDVITLRGVGEIKTKEFWGTSLNTDYLWRMSIEDPFETVDSVHSHDLGKTVHSIQNQQLILDSIKNLSNLLETRDLASLQEAGDKWYFPTDVKDVSIYNKGAGRGGRGGEGRGREGRGGRGREEMKDFNRDESDTTGRKVLVTKGGSKQGNKGQIQCYKCHGIGHIAKECKEGGKGDKSRGREIDREEMKEFIRDDLDAIGKKELTSKGNGRQQNKGQIKCHNCGKFGHFAKECRA